VSDILSAIQDDIDQYKELCALYKEEVRYTDGNSPDCYGKHSDKLLARQRQARKRWVAPETLERISRRRKC
jgi:hypothetical protein